MSGELPAYVLDSFAMIAYFCKEPGGDKVKTLIEQALSVEVVLHLSIINLGETYYMFYKKFGQERAELVVADTKQLPIRVSSVTDSQVWEAAEIKAHYSVSYADAFAASLAQTLNASVVTGDPEFKNINNGIKVFWLLENNVP